MRLTPANCQPPMTASRSPVAPPPHRLPLPNGSAHVKLVVLLYGWLYSDRPKSASRLRKSCGAGKLPLAFSSDCDPLSFVSDSVSELRSVTSRDTRHSTLPWNA